MIIGLAPMDGFTDYAFRQITKEIFQKHGDKKTYEFMLRTEFMNANGYLINPVGVVKHLLSNKEQAPLIAQIFGNDKETLVQCFEDIDRKYSINGKLKMENGGGRKSLINSPSSIFNHQLSGGLEKQGNETIQSSQVFSGLELNLGCPAKTVIQNGGGSAMLKDRKQVLEILKDIKKQTTLPLSIKTRTGITDDDTIQQKDFLIQASKYCSMITIHGRTVKQVYSGDADREFMYDIKRKVERLKSGNMETCKILGNGGITSYEEIDEKKLNLDGILIGQSAIGNPRIFTPHTPSTKELRETILRHLELMVASEIYFQQQAETFTGTLIMPTKKELDTIISTLPQLSKKASGLRSKDSHLSAIVVAFRKHLFQYIKGITGSKERKREISLIKDYEQLVEAIKKFMK